MRKRVFKILGAVVVVTLVLLVVTGWWGHRQIAGSLPKLDGVQTVAGLQNEVRIERDSLGIPTIHAKNRLDLAFATGFVHAQDRYFQMDLLRRNSAGELSEIVGVAALDHDRSVRVHRFRDVARRVIESGRPQERELLEAYSAGANAGLAALDKKPFEYLLLGETPAPWKPEDSALVMFSMYLDLQGSDFRDEAKLGLMSDMLPAPLFEFMAPRGTSWDAPIQGEAFETPPIPGPEVFDTRQPKQVAQRSLTPLDQLAAADVFHPGSNNWAVAGSHTADGRAMVANDMHLGINVPHIWYRASFVWPDDADSAVEQRMTGASLPGTPAIVVGSNGHVAWGFTNSEGDWVDVVLVETEGQSPDHYLTPNGPLAFEHHAENIKVKGGPDEPLDVVTTIWGPIVDRDHRNRPRAIRWVAHDTDGVNMGLLQVESAKTLDQAMRLANLSGSPAQNFVVADDQGHIAWTILGRIPRRVGFDGRLPSSWADGSHRWDGYLTPEEYPRVINPDQGRLWTANARVVGGEFLAKLGDGGYDLGARAKQIRDDLLAIDQASEADMLKIQLDDRAVFLEAWRQVLLDVLTPEALEAEPRRKELRSQVENWGGHAAADSVGFRIVREFRHRLLAQLADLLTVPCKQADESFTVAGLDRTEGPVWRLVSERPDHMLDPRFESWDALLLAAADQVNARATGEGTPLSEYTWGRFNTTRIRHPLSVAIPAFAEWLDMPPRGLNGDSENIPRIQSPNAGASQRMAVSPGHEADGYFHMPCGQSGHPMSPHYGDAHEAWVEGKATPFLPGPAVHQLVLKPAP